MKRRALALAGVLQAVQLVRQIAETGSADGNALKASLDSVFRIDADSVEDVYGSGACLHNGLETLLRQLEGGAQRDPTISRIAVTVLHVERKLSRRRDLLQAISEGIARVQRAQTFLESVQHPSVLAQLGELYGDTVSTLSPRVLVPGNPVYLAQSQVVAEIRAVLLSAVRSAVLWRQLGGSYWDLLLRRGQLAGAARGWLKSRD